MCAHLVHFFSTLVLLLLELSLVLPLLAGEPNGKRPQLDHHGDPLPPLARHRIGTLRLRHGGEIVSLAFAPDGRKIASIGRDGVLNVWDAASGKRLASSDAPDGVAVAFAEEGQALLWCDVRGSLYRCDAGPSRRIHRFDSAATERIDVAAFAGDGSTAVVGTSGSHVLFWGRKVELKLRDGIQAVALDHSGQRFAVNNGHEGIRIEEWGGQRQARGTILILGADAVRSLAFSPDGRLLAAGDFDNRILLWDINTGQKVRVLEGHDRVPISGKNGIFCLAFSPDGNRLASGAAEGTVRVWDVKSGKELAHCSGHGRPVRALAFSPDGKSLASGGDDNAVRLWEPTTGRAIGPTADEGGAVTGMSVSSDGRILALVRLPGELRFWDMASGKELPTPKLPTPVAAAVFTPKGHALASATGAGHLHFWDCEKGEELRKPQDVHAPIRLLAAANDGTIVAWCGDNHRVVLWNAKTGKEIQQLRPPGNRISELRFSPDGEMLFVAGSAGVRQFSFRETIIQRDLSGPVSGAFAVAVSPDGRTLATSGQNGAVRLWEIVSGKQRRAMYGDTAAGSAVSFSSDGTLLATGSRNGYIRLWDVLSGQRLHSFGGHRGAVVAVAFAARGHTLISASVDGTALVWDLPALLDAGRSKVIELSSRQLQALWHDLAGDDAPRAYEAVETLARAPMQSVPFLRQQVAPVSAQRRSQRLKELDSDDYKTRVRAMNELSEMGRFAESALRKLLAEKPSLEARRRAEELLALVENPSASAEHLRSLRAVEVLERIGTEPARQALQDLANGATEAALTHEAKAALARLDRKGK